MTRHGKTHDLNRRFRFRLREVWERHSKEFPGELLWERGRLRGRRNAWYLRRVCMANLLWNTGGDRRRGCDRTALVVLPKAGNEGGLVSRPGLSLSEARWSEAGDMDILGETAPLGLLLELCDGLGFPCLRQEDSRDEAAGAGGRWAQSRALEGGAEHLGRRRRWVGLLRQAYRASGGLGVLAPDSGDVTHPNHAPEKPPNNGQQHVTASGPDRGSLAGAL